MCNEACIEFGKKNLSKEMIEGKRVIEIGSYDVNGSLKNFIVSLNPSEYIGIDIQKGPNVDIVCEAENIIKKFGRESFDVVISTELMEHVEDWKKVISNFKNICKADGIILITTRSYGFGYHEYPCDFWRYELDDMQNIFSDCQIINLESDPSCPGIFIITKKPKKFVEKSLLDYELYNILIDKRVKSVINKNQRDSPPKILILKEKLKNFFRPNLQKSFEEIGKSKNTDKVLFHGYHRFYPLFLEKYRNKEIIMLEIGLNEGESLKLWEEYFPLSKIYGIDIENKPDYNPESIFIGNQSDIDFLQKVIEKINRKIDFIIDDGSHKPEHQLKTFCYLFLNLLKDGGTYIIEDIETNYWREGSLYKNTIKKGYKHKGSVIEIFKDMIDKVNEEFIKDKSVFNSSLIPKNVQDKIGLLSFGHNCIIIIKKDEKYLPFENREYIYSSTL